MRVIINLRVKIGFSTLLSGKLSCEQWPMENGRALLSAAWLRMSSAHSALIRNLIKLKGTAKLTGQDELVCLKDSKYILFEILENKIWIIVKKGPQSANQESNKVKR